MKMLLFCMISLLAAEELPQNPRLRFNYGAELASSSRFDEAEDVLRQVAVVKDKTVAAKALTLLGQMAVASAKQNVAEKPAETPPEQRQMITKYLQAAEKDFTESLALQPNDEVRRHLETLRAWRHSITQHWQEYDREQQRKNEQQRRIQWLADWEDKLIERVQPAAQEADSPRKSQTGYESGKEQQQLAEELALLQKEPLQNEELQEQWGRLPEIQKIAEESAKLLTQHQLDEALPKQQQVRDYLRTLIKQEPNQSDQNQQNQDQQQKNQEQNKQEPQKKEEQNQSQQSQQPQPQESNDQREQEQEMNSASSSSKDGIEDEEGKQKKEDEAKAKADRQLMQVRRKEQAAEKRREQLRALLMQSEPVEKDW